MLNSASSRLYNWPLLIVLGLFTLAIGPRLFAASPDRVRNPRDYLRIARVQYGTASWYGAHWQGRKMACGERFNQYAMTAAHRTLPLGTEVKVTNLHNGRSVYVRIKDRGPYIGSRLIDLSKAAAERLGFTERGLAPVRVQVVKLPQANEPAVSAPDTRMARAATSRTRRNVGTYARAGAPRL